MSTGLDYGPERSGGEGSAGPITLQGIEYGEHQGKGEIDLVDIAGSDMFERRVDHCLIIFPLDQRCDGTEVRLGLAIRCHRSLNNPPETGQPETWRAASPKESLLRRQDIERTACSISNIASQRGARRDHLFRPAESRGYLTCMIGDDDFIWLREKYAAIRALVVEEDKRASRCLLGSNQIHKR